MPAREGPEQAVSPSINDGPGPGGYAFGEGPCRQASCEAIGCSFNQHGLEMEETVPLLRDAGGDAGGGGSGGCAFWRTPRGRRRCCIRTIYLALLSCVLLGIFAVYVLPNFQKYHPHTAPVPRIPPGAPTSVNITATGTTHIALQWNKPPANTAQIVRFHVERSSAAGQVTAMSAFAFSLDDIGLMGSEKYCYKVRAESSAGLGNYSKPVCSTTQPPTVPATPDPPVPVNTSSATIALAFSTLNFSDGGAPLLDLVVEQQAQAANDWSLCCNLSVADPVVACTATNLAAGTEYGFRGAAANKAGLGQWTPTLVLHTDRAGATAPAAVAPPTESDQSHSSLRVTWVAPDDGGAQILSYVVECGVRGDGKVARKVIHRGFSPLAATAFNLTASTTYCFRVSASNSIGDGPWGPDACFKTKAAGAPEAPVFHAAPLATSPTSLLVGWTEPDTGGSPIVAYDLEKDDYWVDQPLTTIHNGTGLSFNASVHMLPATKYSFRVTAYNVHGSSPPSQVVAYTTDRAGQCGNPSDVAAYKATKTTMKKAIQGCLISCITRGDACARTCIGQKVGLSTGCAGCWVDEGHCTEKNCIVPCFQPSSANCKQCSKSKCFPDCVRCSGIPMYFFPP